jgi:biotin carboxyl carrier protein
VKGEYGKTPVPVDPDFRLKIAGTREEIPYDTSNYQHQPNPVLPEFGDVLLAKDEKEQLLLELFPTVALNYLKGVREKEYNELNQQIAQQKKQEEVVKEPEVVITGKVIESPMPGTIWKLLVKEGDTIKRGDSVLILEAMKMENNIASEYNGTVKRIFVKEGSFVKAESVIMEIEE